MIYLAIFFARSTQDAGHYINGNRDMPAWGLFLVAGIMASSVGIYDSGNVCRLGFGIIILWSALAGFGF